MKKNIHQYDNKKLDGWRAESKLEEGESAINPTVTYNEEFPIGSSGQPVKPGF